MRKCPSCQKWTLDFDDYFGRYRCFNPECAWMPPSSTEREIRLLRSRKEPTLVSRQRIEDLDLTFTACYDSENDALVFDFGLSEPTFDLPEADGRMVWRIGRQSDSVSGFCILGAKKFGVSGVVVDVLARKEDIERSLKSIGGVSSSGTVTRVLIDKVLVSAHETGRPVSNPKAAKAFQNAITQFASSCPK